MDETHFLETRALLAVMHGNRAQAQRLVDSMLPGERRRLHIQLTELSALLLEANAHLDQPSTPAGQGQ